MSKIVKTFLQKKQKEYKEVCTLTERAKVVVDDIKTKKALLAFSSGGADTLNRRLDEEHALYKAGLTQLIKQQREIANLGQDLMLTYLNRNDKLEERCDLFDNDKRFTLEEV